MPMCKGGRFNQRLYERHGLRVTGVTEIHWHMAIDPPPANTIG